MSHFAKLGDALPARLRPWAARLAKFFAGQGALQAINVVTGFFLLRWLSVEDYALFGVAFGFQSMLTVLVDLGFGGCIPALTGTRVNDPTVIGRYIAAARAWRRLTFLIVLPPAALAFAGIGARQGWSWVVQAALFACIAAALFFEGRVAWHGSVLTMQHRLGRYYRTAIEVSAARLTLSALLHFAGWLGAVVLAGLNAVATIWTGWRYRAQTADVIAEPPRADRETRHEMIRYLGPLIPGIAFAALQGQLLVLLMSFFGRTQNIAEVAALGRIGQLFVLLNAFNSVIIGPFFARLPREWLGQRYFQAVGVGALFAAGLVALAYALPQPLLWLLGPKYAHLRMELVWTMAAASISYFSGVIWTIHSARKWIYWWGAALYIVALTVVQIVFVAVASLETTRNVLVFGVVTSVATLLVHVPTAFVGFRTPVADAPV